MTAREWALLLALAGLWGGSFFFAEIALADLPPVTLVALRVAIAAAALFVYLRASGTALPRGRALWAAFLAMGALNNAIPQTLMFWGQTHIDSGLVAILNGASPLWTALIGHAWTRDERLTRAKAGGLVAGVAGLAVMIGPDALAGLGSAALAQFAVVAGTVSYACAGLFGRRFKGVNPVATAFGQLAGATLLMLPVAALADRPWTLALPRPGALAALAALALAATAAAYVLYFRILATAGATNLLLVTLLMPVIALVLGIAFLDESFGPRELAGMALIALGLAAIDGRLLPARAQPR